MAKPGTSPSRAHLTVVSVSWWRLHNSYQLPCRIYFATQPGATRVGWHGQASHRGRRKSENETQPTAPPRNLSASGHAPLSPGLAHRPLQGTGSHWALVGKGSWDVHRGARTCGLQRSHHGIPRALFGFQVRCPKSSTWEETPPSPPGQCPTRGHAEEKTHGCMQ